MIGKGGRAELVGWETKTARLLPRYLQRRTHGPLFLAYIAPAPGRQPALADIDLTTGHARLSYRRAAEIFRTATGGWTLHQLRRRRARCSTAEQGPHRAMQDAPELGLPDERIYLDHGLSGVVRGRPAPLRLS